MLDSGHPPSDWGQLLAEARAESERLGRLASGGDRQAGLADGRYVAVIGAAAAAEDLERGQPLATLRATALATDHRITGAPARGAISFCPFAVANRVDRPAASTITAIRGGGMPNVTWCSGGGLCAIR